MKLFFICKLYILLDKIELQLYHCCSIDYLLTKCFYVLPKATLQLLMGRIHRLDALCVNQIGNSRGLVKIQFSVEKGALGKFARFRSANTLYKNGFQNSLRYKNAAVTGNLNRIFTRIRP